MNSPERLVKRRFLFSALASIGLVLASIAGCGGSGDNIDAPSPPLQSAWSAAIVSGSASTVLTDQTVRYPVRLATDGSAVRVRVSNLLGTAPITLDSLHIARSTGTTSIDTTTDATVTFGGQAAVTLPAGTERWSDETSFVARRGSMMTVSIYLRNATPILTTGGQLQNGVTATGNVVAASDVSGSATATAYLFNQIDVRSSAGAGVLVAFGDSITAGQASTQNGNKRYPDQLNDRIAADASSTGINVTNVGISGNRILNDFVGTSGLARFDRDVLTQSNVRGVLILEGINDIQLGASFGPVVSSDQIIGGLTQLIQRAKAAGLRAYLGTLTPSRGNVRYSDDGETKRQAVNQWIRTQALADGVVDFDLAVRDPADHSRLLAVNDSGDGLHPSDAGYAAMAQAVPIEFVRNLRR